MILFLKLLLAHFLGDFVFQPEGWVKEKSIKKHKSPKLYLHALLHGAFSFILVAKTSFWPYALIITATHLLIDWCKLEFQNKQTMKRWFFIDQSLHLAILIGIAYHLRGGEIDLGIINQQKTLLVITAMVFLSMPSSVLIRILISGWTPNTEDDRRDSLENAGKYIGILERLLVFIFILTDRWEAIGFLLAAKSVFRFGDLKESRERKLTEYVLIGTLLSFGIAIVIGLLAQSFL